MLNWLKRENFSEKTKTKIIKNASRCQMCYTFTNCGECAHIVGSGKNGPRNKIELTHNGIIPEDYDVQSVDNGLYLCANCHTKIDKYPKIYTFEYLKSLAEHEDDTNVNRIDHDNSDANQIDHDNSDANRIDHDGSDANRIDHKDIYKCNVCDKVLSSLERLNYHLSKKVCQRPSRICPLCGKLFKSKQSCQYHISQNVCTKRKSKLVMETPPEKMSQQELIDKIAQAKEKLLMVTIENKVLKEHHQTVNNILLYSHQLEPDDMNHVKNKLDENIKTPQ